jgi:hypothetical protein
MIIMKVLKVDVGDVENLIDQKVKQVLKSVVSSNLVLFK